MTIDTQVTFALLPELLTCYSRTQGYLSLQESDFAIILTSIQTFGIKVSMVISAIRISLFESLLISLKYLNYRLLSFKCFAHCSKTGD